MNNSVYSVGHIVSSLKDALHQYLEAQYHVWDESLIRERRALFNNVSEAVTNQIPALEATPFYGYGKTFEQLEIPVPAKDALIRASKLGVGIYPKPYRHQADALEAFLTGQHDIIVATGTGSGKTESFLMPLLGTMAIEANDRLPTASMPGMRALLLYPMNALVNDQLARLRRLFGHPEVADILSGKRGRRVTFGMYTSRTPYPGVRQASKDNRIVKKLVEQLFGADAKAVKELLEKEGKWPAKDMEAFAASNFHTHPDDRELYTRQEMHERCPDILVTNYSMLEYMLLRPVEKALFDQTEQWLESDASNQLVIVLDEAHMYRGATGAEVGLLLRRLQSRLKVDRNRIRYILTSASLGSGRDAKQKIIEFAGALTGLNETGRKFHLIQGTAERMQDGQPATAKDIVALKDYPYATLHKTQDDLAAAASAFNQLLMHTGRKPLGVLQTEKELRNAIYEFLEQYPPACALANLITGQPHTFHEILESVFGHTDGREALESLLALAAFAQRKSDERVFLPVRLHTFYRGISGLYACINPECTHRHDKSGGLSLLGRLFDSPRRWCLCGSRVYELLTHRDCGAAFIRAYLPSPEGDFAWHEAGSSHESGRALLEVHFLVESLRNREEDTCTVWLHKKTGRILRHLPAHKTEDFIQLIRSTGEILRDTGTSVHSFDHECPVCRHGWNDGTNKIMDLATKGEAPFAHLTATQLRLQPSFKKADDRYPNQGRKNLLFSDGRQKAARLARDIPREVGQDVFRQVLLYAVHSLNQEGQEAKLDTIYPAVLFILKKFNLSLFDGRDYQRIIDDLRSMGRERYENIAECTTDFRGTPPDRFNEQLLRQLGSSFYSIHALTLGYTIPTNRAMKGLEDELSWLKADEIKALAIAWIQNLLRRMAYDSAIGSGVRCRANGWPADGWGVSSGFIKKKLPIIEGIYGRASEIEATFKRMLAQEKDGAYFIEPRRVKLELAVHSTWHQCQKCLSLSPVTWKGHCVHCGETDTKVLDPATSDYLRARKTFWRDPVINILEGRASPFNLNVCEHTAQLSYRDQDEIKSTTEEYERLFKDILLRPDESPIDMLSCTTTMEVGIDIGSLIAVGLRNIPPQRQNYQQRVGRTGRRGAAISTVLTYAQNSPHDYFYFKNIKKVIAGDPPLPMVDICNPRLIQRHVHATLIQHFFHTQVVNVRTRKNNVFDVLGDTWEFYTGSGDFSLSRFREWLKDDAPKEGVFEGIQRWIPKTTNLNAQKIAADLLTALADKRPITQDELEGSNNNLIEFLFNRGLLPSYAFPKDLCALQIEKRHKEEDGRWVIETIEKPQQGLNIALSEYAPGRLVVVDKKTYRVAAVTANRASTVADRAAPLFQNIKAYNHCHDCCFTQTRADEEENSSQCPVCDSVNYETIEVIQPEVVFPQDCGPIDELDDEQVFSTSTSAQLPVPKMEEEWHWQAAGKYARFAYAENQSLVMLNKGKPNINGRHTGFLVCDKCGHSGFPDQDDLSSPHQTHYLVQRPWGVERPSCDGTYRPVSLGYSFVTDLLLFNIALTRPFDTQIHALPSRMALEDALTSLSDALSLAACHTLDIDLRELNAGYRLINRKGTLSADIFLYDTVAGGAGYSAMAGAQFDKILQEAKHILDDCTCDTSCDKCLRHYGNKHYHSSLDRNLASALLDYAIDGILPKIKDIKDQLAELAELKQVLEMAGWAYEHATDVPLLMKRRERVLKIATCPALLDPRAAGHQQIGTCKVISTYRLQNNLAGVFAEVGS